MLRMQMEYLLQQVKMKVLTITSGTNPSTYSAPAETTGNTCSNYLKFLSVCGIKFYNSKESDSVQAPNNCIADTSALTAEEISNVAEAIKGSKSDCSFCSS